MNKVLSTNVTAVHLITQALLPLLEKGNLKKIVNVFVTPHLPLQDPQLTLFRTSTLGSIAMAEGYLQSTSVAYKVSKAALNMLTVQYAFQLGKQGFTVFCISPGVSPCPRGYVDIEEC